MYPKGSSSGMLFDEFLEKMRAYCAYRDRCKKEAAEKLFRLGANKELTEKILKALEAEGFIDEARFAETFARGKFEHNRWGKIRIRQELAFRNIPESIIEYALLGIDQAKYLEVLENLARKKFDAVKGQTEFTTRGKTAEHCIRKGYENDLVWKMINKLKLK